MSSCTTLPQTRSSHYDSDDIARIFSDGELFINMEEKRISIEHCVAPLFPDQDLHHFSDSLSIDGEWSEHSLSPAFPYDTTFSADYTYQGSSINASHTMPCSDIPSSPYGQTDSILSSHFGHEYDTTATTYSVDGSDASCMPTAYASRGLLYPTPESTMASPVVQVEPSILSLAHDVAWSPETSFSDVDAECKTDGEYNTCSVSDECEYMDDADVGEYHPSSRLRSSQLPRSSFIHHSRASASISVGAQRVPCPVRRRRLSPYPPSQQTPTESSPQEDMHPPYVYTAGRMEQVSSNTPTPLPHSALRTLKCPRCGYRPSKNRPSDLHRHYSSHFDEKSSRYVCCGVRIDRALEYGVTDFSNVYEHDGEMRVGQCWRVFTRRDALLRHVKNPKMKCVCDVLPSREYMSVD